MLQAQNWIRDSVATGFKIDQYVLDPFNGLYISDADGNIHNFDFKGEKRKTFNIRINEPVTDLSIPVSGRIGVFYENRQLYVFLDRFLNEQSRLEIPELTNDYVLKAVLGSNNTLWLLTSFGDLIKYDLLIRKEVLRQNLSKEIEDLKSLKISFHDHLILIHEENTLSLFDEFGNFLDQMDSVETNLKFYKNRLIVSNAFTYDLLDLISKKKESVPIPTPYRRTKKVLIGKDKHFHFFNKYFEVWAER
ncbi:MAG: hypothetical protein AAF363_09825 [Bacteroidota bacterium]